jgi:prepilin-type N-terminal cleavage/methylation domain-containing protein
MKTIFPLRHCHCHCHRRRCYRAFTLVELLTVIAIIGLLAGILIPTVSAVRKKANHAKAVSNIRQLVLAHHAYAVENRDQFPVMYNSTATPPVTTSWQGIIAPYVNYTVGTKGDDRYRHRGDPRTIFNVPDSRPFKEQGRGVNDASIARNYYSDDTPFRRTSLIPTPSRYILLGECEEHNADRMNTLKKSGSGYADNKSGQCPLLPKNTDLGAFRREGGTRALTGFCDGHVKALTREELRDDITPANGNPWRWW